MIDNYRQTRRINISASCSLIHITSVLVSLAIHTLHQQTLEWIYAHGDQAVVTTAQLHTRSINPPLPIFSSPFGFSTPAPPSSTLCNDHTSFQISYKQSSLPNSTIKFCFWNPEDADPYTYDDDGLEVSCNFTLIIF